MLRTLWLLVCIAALAPALVAHAADGKAGCNQQLLPYVCDVLPENIPDFNREPDGGLLVKELRRGNPSLKEVALTFDDGPHPAYTSCILAILHHYRVPVTFFMVGVQAARYPEWVKMAFQEGHEIGSHTYDHFRLVGLPFDEQTYQIEEFQQLIFKLTGTYPRFLRPPGGSYNAQTVELMNRNGLAVGLWSFNPKDLTDVAAQELYRSILQNVSNGGVIMLHDGSAATVEMLPLLIETLKRRGYRFVTMSQMLAHADAKVLPRSAEAAEAEAPASPEPEEKPEPGRWKIISY